MTVSAGTPAGPAALDPGLPPGPEGTDPDGARFDTHPESLHLHASHQPYVDDTQLAALDAWWRAANYLSVGQIYLMANPLLREPLLPEHVKPRLLGHWGTTPGLNFVHAHLNRAVTVGELDLIYVFGPGHGGAAAVAAAWLDGRYGEVYPHVADDADGMRRLFTQFSFPGGIPSHVAPQTPGSIHEGGELGHSLSHAFGAAFDNPDLVVACVVGDGEAETGPLAASWHSTKFLDPVGDGAVLPILHLNGYKSANPSVLARIPEPELVALLLGYGWDPIVVSGADRPGMHHAFARALDGCLERIRQLQSRARSGPGVTFRPRWPMIILRTPKGWTGPQPVDGLPGEGSGGSHQVPFRDARTNSEHLAVLETWLRSYRPQDLFDERGAPVPLVRSLSPSGRRRLSANPHANGGELLRDLRMPDLRAHAVPVERPGTGAAEATRVLATFLREVMELNLAERNFRVVSPDGTDSNRLDALLEVTDRSWTAERLPADPDLGVGGRVMEILSEPTCQGWLEGYLLTGRHGVFSCNEAFAHIVDSMADQHAQWLRTSRELPWRRPIASLNYLLTSHVWSQDHNGCRHHDPGFIDQVVNKKADVIRVYLPPDANTLLSVADHCLRSRDHINVIVAGTRSAVQFLDREQAIVHCTKGLGIWEWASTDAGTDPDLVMACAGDVPTTETLAAVDLLLGFFPELRIRVVNVVDLMRLQDEREHPHGLSDAAFDTLFTRDTPVIFAYHGYPWLIHRLTYRRANHHNLHVRGYQQESTTSTPFDLCVMNRIDRFHLAMDALDRLPGLGERAAHPRQQLEDTLIRHHQHTRATGEDLPEVRHWQWTR